MKTEHADIVLQSQVAYFSTCFVLHKPSQIFQHMLRIPPAQTHYWAQAPYYSNQPTYFDTDSVLHKPSNIFQQRCRITKPSHIFLYRSCITKQCHEVHHKLQMIQFKITRTSRTQCTLTRINVRNRSCCNWRTIRGQIYGHTDTEITESEMNI